MKKFSAMDIANFYVQLSQDLPEGDITNLKLNKLCYYAQGWSLVRLGRPLFDDEIQAWKYGPVIPSVYHTYKVCGENPIAEPASRFDEAEFDTDELNLLIDVYMTYGKYSPGQLVSMTHAAGGPWAEVFEEMQNHVISVAAMQKYFSQSNELEVMRMNVTQGNVVTYA